MLPSKTKLYLLPGWNYLLELCSSLEAAHVNGSKHESQKRRFQFLCKTICIIDFKFNITAMENICFWTHYSQSPSSIHKHFLIFYDVLCS